MQGNVLKFNVGQSKIKIFEKLGISKQFDDEIFGLIFDV